MGMATAQLRLVYLNQYRNDLEFKEQLITEAKMNLDKTNSDMMSVGTDWDSDEPLLKKLEARKARLHVMEKQLDDKLNSYRNKIKMIEAEIQSCEQLLDKNIQRSFKY